MESCAFSFPHEKRQTNPQNPPRRPTNSGCPTKDAKLEFSAGCSEGLRNSQPKSCSVACGVSDIRGCLLTFLITVKHAIWAGGPQGTVCCNCIYKTHRDEMLSWGSHKICAYTGGTILPAMLLAPMAQEGEGISRGPRQERMEMGMKASC